MELRGGLSFLSPISSRSTIVNANNQFGVSGSGAFIDYMEKVGGEKFDSERGWVPGLSVSGSVMQDWGVDNLYLFGQFSWSKGHSRYIGAFQNGTYGDLRQDDGAEMFREDVRIGKGFDLNNSFMLTPYLGAGARQWSRHLPGVGGLQEDYSNGYVGGGLLAQYSPAPRWVVSVNGMVGSTFRSTMKTSRINGGANINPQTYDLGEAAMFMAGASVDYAVSERLHANLGVDVTNFKYGKSPVSFDSTYEPTSRTTEVVVKAGIGVSF